MKNIDSSSLVSIIRDIYNSHDDCMLSLHEPRFISDEKNILNQCIDSTYVSTIGEYVPLFEEKIKNVHFIWVDYRNLKWHKAKGVELEKR